MSKRYSIGLLLAGTLVLAACGGTATTPKVGAGSSASQLRAASSVGFGAVALGGSRFSSVAMSNTSAVGKNITISQIDVSGAGFRLGNLPAMPFQIAAGESVTVAIVFSPVQAGSANGKISIMSDAANAVVPVSLSGTGNSAGQISVSPGVLNFGNVNVGNSAILNGTITAANSSVTISTVNQTGNDYSLSGISFPITLAPGQSAPFAVTFTPQASGAWAGSIAFVTSTGTAPTAALIGSGGQTSSAHDVALSWNASSSSVVGYNLYRGTQSGGPYTKLTGAPQSTTNYADSTVQSGATYYYVATSVNSNAEESGFSNQTVASIP